MMTALILLLLAFSLALWALPPKEEPEKPRRESNVKRRPRRVRFRDIHVDPDRFCHRTLEALSKDRLSSLARSLLQEGQLNPLLVVARDQGGWDLVGGYRRQTCIDQLIADNEDREHFFEDMEVDCVELLDADEADLTVISLTDNTNRADLTVSEKIKATLKLRAAKVSQTRGAAALRLSVTQFNRFALIADYGQMYDHIQAKDIDVSAAAEVLHEAKKADRAEEFLAFFKTWVAARREEIDKRDEWLKSLGKKMPEGEKFVKRFVKKHIVKGWIDCLTSGRPLNDGTWKFGAFIDHKQKKLVIPSVNMDLSKSTSEEIAQIAATVMSWPRLLAPYAQARAHEEGLEVDAQDDPVVDRIQYLESIGLHDQAAALRQEHEQRLDEEAGEDDPDFEKVPPQTEQDLGREIDRTLSGPAGSKDGNPETGELGQVEDGPEGSEDE
jgi:hypothetical protein